MKSKRQRIIEEHRNGLMVQEIVNKLGVHRSYVYNTIYDIGDLSNDNKATRAREEKVRELYHQEYSHKEIAEQLGLHPNSVSRIVRRIGLTPIRERKNEKLLEEAFK